MDNTNLLGVALIATEDRARPLPTGTRRLKVR